MEGTVAQQNGNQLLDTPQTRSQRIVEMYASGTPQNRIADILGISTQAVSRTIVKYRTKTTNPDLKSSQRDDRICELSRQGVPVRQIAAEVGCSTRTVQYVRSKHPDSKGCNKSTACDRNLPSAIILGGSFQGRMVPMPPRKMPPKASIWRIWRCRRLMFQLSIQLPFSETRAIPPELPVLRKLPTSARIMAPRLIPFPE